MRLSRVAFCLCFIILLGFTDGADNNLYNIPERTIQPNILLGDTVRWYEQYDTYKMIIGPTNKNEKQDMPQFEISKFVTYAEYKGYLKEMEKDSSHSFYLSQLPDSTMCAPDIYKKYIDSKQYDNYPVLGISWNAAMNYCRWMTLKENKDSIQYIYRLPRCSEWLDAIDYLKNQYTENDFNKNYSDWLINAKDETPYDDTRPFIDNVYDYVYFQEKQDPQVLTRKFVIGKSYLFSWPDLYKYFWDGYYASHGYRQVGFRYVKCKITSDKLTNALLKYWGGMAKKKLK